MKMNWKDIFRVLRVMLIVIGMVFFLSACNSNDEADVGEDATKQTENATASNITCFQRGIIDILYDAGGTAAMGAYDGLTKGALTVTMLGFAFWFSFRMLKYLGSFTEQNAAQLWTEVGRQFFLCMVCGMLAQSSSMALWTLNTLIFPIFFSFLELGSAVLNMNASELGSSTQCVAGDSLEFPAMTCTASLGEVSPKGFPNGPKEMMGCMVCSINSRLSIGLGLSQKLRAGGLMSWFMSIILVVVMLIVRLSFVFYLVDAVFRMTLMIVLFPLLTIAYAFNATRKWAITGLQILLNCSALACFIGILMAMVLVAVQKVIEMYNGLGVSSDPEVDSGPQAIVILLLAFLMKSSVDVAKSVTDGLVDGGGDSSFASRGAKVLAWAAMKLLSVVTSGATVGLEKAAEHSERLRKIKEAIEKIKKKRDKLAGRGRPSAPKKPTPPPAEGGVDEA